MSNTCVVGLQWGDEAKGKIVDLLCDVHDVVPLPRADSGSSIGHPGGPDELAAQRIARRLHKLEEATGNPLREYE